MQAEVHLNTFSEEVYHTPAPFVVAIPSRWDALNQAEKGLLEKILGALKLSLHHVRILETQQLDIAAWVDAPSKVIAFGVHAPGVAKNEVHYIQSTKFIVTATLAELEPDAEGKKKLWGALKVLNQ